MKQNNKNRNNEKVVDEGTDVELYQAIQQALINEEIEKIEKKYKNNIVLWNLAWFIGILIAINILLLAKEFGSNENMMNLISIASGLISIVLALVAIGIALKQELNSNSVTTVMMLKLGELDKRISNLDMAIKSMKELSNLKIDSLSQQMTEKINNTDKIDKNEVEIIIKDILKNQIDETSKYTRSSITKSERDALLKKAREIQERNKKKIEVIYRKD